MARCTASICFRSPYATSIPELSLQDKACKFELEDREQRGIPPHLHMHEFQPGCFVLLPLTSISLERVVGEMLSMTTVYLDSCGMFF